MDILATFARIVAVILPIEDLTFQSVICSFGLSGGYEIN